MGSIEDMLASWKGILSDEEFKIVKQYITTFKEPWSHYGPLDMNTVLN